MFKKLFASFVVVAILTAGTSAFAPRMCLNPGSYVFASAKDGSIARIKVGHEPKLIENIKFFNFGLFSGLDGVIAVDKCDGYFSASKTGGLPDLYHFNPSTGMEIHKVTRTPDKIEMDPVIDPSGNHIAFTEISGISSVVTTYLDGTRPMTEALNAAAPAWEKNGMPSWTDLTNGRIYPWGAKGQWHAYLPDRSGILVQDGQDFYIWPVVGVARDFGKYRSVAIDPEGGMAVVVTLDGRLAFQPVSANWMPEGNLIVAQGGSFVFATWIEVPQL
jgi:hypothetical protein